jgi:maltose alpha-D-glucosyltransferase/alpha-amylase
MQWTSGLNAGFSQSPEALISPLIEDPTYGYSTLNVEDQERDPDSRLARMRRLIRVRRAHRVFGRGTTKFVETHDAAILGFWRQYGNEGVLVLANLSTTLETCTLTPPHDLTGPRVVDLLTDRVYDAAATAPFRLTLEPSAFVWLSPTSPAAAPSST